MLYDFFFGYNQCRMKAVAYLASYLARAKFISSSMVASILKRFVTNPSTSLHLILYPYISSIKPVLI